jgi:hemerythrin-like domain-containing protein
MTSPMPMSVLTVGTGAVEIVLNDHRTIKELLAKLPHAADHGNRRLTLEALKALLTVHNAMEESLIYPALALVAGDKPKAEQLYHETAEADQAVFELDTMLKTGAEADFPAKAAALREAVLKHIDEEELTAVPELQRAADQAHTAILNGAVREFRTNFTFVMHPNVKQPQITTD